MESNVVGIRHDGIWIILFWGSGCQLLFHLPWYTTSLSNKALLCEERRFFSITLSSFLENRQSWVLLLIGTSIVKGVTGFLLLASTIIILLVLIVAWQNGLPCYERSQRRREDRINVVDVINIMTQKFKNRTDGSIIIPGTRVKRTFFNMDSQNNHSQCDHQPSVCRNFQRVYNCQKFKKHS